MDLETRIKTVEDILQHVCRSRRLNSVKQCLLDSLDASIRGREEKPVFESVNTVKEDAVKEDTVKEKIFFPRASTQTT